MTSNDGGYYPPPDGQQWGGSQVPPPGFPGNPGYPGYPQQPLVKGKSPWPWLIGGGAVLVVLVVVAAVAFFAFGSGGDDGATLVRTTVTYEVTGATDSVELIFMSAEGQTHLKAVALPWGETVTLEGEDAYFHVSARRGDGSGGELACRVTARGTTLVEDQTIGDYVGCDGRVNEQ